MNTSTEPAPSFTALGLSEFIQAAIQAIGYETPSPIQAASIPHLLNGEDLLGVAQTGTGKTAAFALPLLSRIDTKKQKPQILVLAPTRELAIQVAEAFKSYASHIPGFKVMPIYGGQDMRRQLQQLERGVHVVVGTPGRIMDHLRRKSLNLKELQALVLDEADEMLRMGFIDDVEWILEHTPEQKQVALFSATMPKPIRKVADQYLKNPQEVRIASETSTAKNIAQFYLPVQSFERKLDALTRILEAQAFDAMIVFVRTKNSTEELAEKLESRGFAAAALNGDMSQHLRERVINRLKRSQLDIVVATDVAARGIDVERVSHVINFDIPYDSEAYVHRIGRTGRAGREGTAILFVGSREKRLLHIIEKTTRQPITMMSLPSGEEVSENRIRLFKQRIDATRDQQSLDYFKALLEAYIHERECSLEDAAAALAFLVQENKPLEAKQKNNSKQEQALQAELQKQSQAFTGRQNNERGDKTKRQKDKRERKQRGAEDDDVLMERYRIEVGKRDAVQPKDIVGAIANEAGVEGRYIGHIALYEDYSTVELPEGMPKDVLQHLQKVRLCQRPLLMKLDTQTAEQGRDKGRRSFAGGKNKPRSGSKNKPSSNSKDKAKVKPKDKVKKARPKDRPIGQATDSAKKDSAKKPRKRKLSENSAKNKK